MHSCCICSKCKHIHNSWFCICENRAEPMDHHEHNTRETTKQFFFLVFSYSMVSYSCLYGRKIYPSPLQRFQTSPQIHSLCRMCQALESGNAAPHVIGQTCWLEARLGQVCHCWEWPLCPGHLSISAPHQTWRLWSRQTLWGLPRPPDSKPLSCSHSAPVLWQMWDGKLEVKHHSDTNSIMFLIIECVILNNKS